MIELEIDYCRICRIFRQIRQHCGIWPKDEIVRAFINGLYKADFSAVNTSFLRQMLT